jgi:hypothetical protein
MDYTVVKRKIQRKCEDVADATAHTIDRSEETFQNCGEHSP